MSSSVSPKITLGCIAAAALLAASISGCGGGEAQDANEPTGNYEVAITKVSFPRKQGLGETSRLLITVQNIGQSEVPDITMTVNGLNYRSTEPGVADPIRPVWVINAGPINGTTAYVNTWALGPLAAGAERSFIWSLSASQPGTRTLEYRAGAGLNGKARAVTADGGVPAGTRVVNVTRRPQDSTVDPATGQVVQQGQ
ncbi:MAG: hypothetical protein NTZ58_01975 [Solirubrobacterales bacterium]|nr:hypothetical protein [Solirubrobacterales bacterium]